MSTTQLAVKVLSAAGIPKRKEYTLYFQYGDQELNLPSVKAQKDLLNEEVHILTYKKDVNVLKIELSGSKLLSGKRLIGSTSVNLSELNLHDGARSNWYTLNKDHKNVGSLQLALELIKKPGLELKIESMSQYDLPADFGITSPRFDDKFEAEKHLGELKPGQARLIVQEVDLGVLNMTKIRLGEGTIIISFKAEDKSMFRVILPHDVKAGETYKQGPAVRTKLENSPHYTLEPSFRFEVAASDADGVLQGVFESRSLDKIKKRCIIMKGCFSVKMCDIKAKLDDDTLTQFEATPAPHPRELFEAVKAGDLETLQTRLEKGDDVNVQNEDGDGLLHVALRDAKEDIIRVLVEFGAEPRLKNKYNETPLDYVEKYHENLLNVVRLYQ